LPRSSWLAPPPITTAIEVAARRVTVVEAARGASGLTVAHEAVAALPDGAVAPALSGDNITDPAAVADAIRAALERAGMGSVRRAALIVPDSIARVALVPFEHVPTRRRELDELLRWQLRRTMPFSIDEAVVTHFPASTTDQGTIIAAVVARRDVVAQYEAVLSSIGIHAGLVDLASFNVMNAVVAAGGEVEGDWLLVHLAAGAATLAILRGRALMFYRHRPALDEESIGALVHQTAMYHEDRLGGGSFARVWLCGSGTAAEDARQEIGRRLGLPAETVDVRSAATWRDTGAPAGDGLDALAAPIGLLVRDRDAA
jgi:Tfp pilus assembly PilM family ATPase